MARLPRSSTLGGPRRGKVAVLVAVSLTALIGATAFALDGGIFLAERRQTQAAADAAALAGASELFRHYAKFNGKDTSATGGAAFTSAQKVAGSNGYPAAEVTINIPPQSGTFQGKASYIEVIIRHEQRRGFSAVFGSDTVPIRARAVARGAWVRPRGAIILLHPDKSGALTSGGQDANQIKAPGGDIVVNSESTTAIVSNGGNVTLAADGYYLTGDTTSASLKDVDGKTDSTNVNKDQPPTPDPLRYLPEPKRPTTEARLQNPSNITIHSRPPNERPPQWWIRDVKTPYLDKLVAINRLDPNRGLTQAQADGISDFYLLDPQFAYTGTGANQLQFTGSGTLVLFKQQTNGAIYYLDNGITSNGAFVMMDPNTSGGMMLFNAGSGSSSGINFGGSGGRVWLVPPSSGIYRDLVIFQSRLSQPVPDISVSGGANFNIDGTIYSQQGNLALSGSATGNVVGSQHISSTMTVQGGADITVKYNGGNVARERIITLVE